MMKKLGIAAITTLILLAPQVALALAPAEPFFYLSVSPKTQEVSAGSSATFQIGVLSQEGFEGQVQFELVDPPEGVTASFEPNPVTVPGYEQVYLTMTVEVASNTPEQAATLMILGKDVKGKARDEDLQFELNIIGGAAQPPPEQPPPEQPPVGMVVTTTVTSTVTATITTPTTVISTVTEVMTTRTPTIGTVTTLTGFDQASELTYPVVTLGVVLALLAVAGVALRKP